jgi:hypothetical protein
MEGLAQPAGAPTTINLGGKKRILQPLTLGDLGTIEFELRKRLPNPIKLVGEAYDLLPQDEQCAACKGRGYHHDPVAEGNLRKEMAEKPNKTRDEARAFNERLLALREPCRPCLGKGLVSRRDELLDRAYEDAKKGNRIPTEDIAEHIDGVDGLIMSMWVMLRKEDKDLTYEQVGAMIKPLSESGQDEMQRIRDMVSGLDEAGNSTGPASDGAPGDSTEKTTTSTAGDDTPAE